MTLYAYHISAISHGAFVGDTYAHAENAYDAYWSVANGLPEHDAHTTLNLGDDHVFQQQTWNDGSLRPPLSDYEEP